MANNPEFPVVIVGAGPVGLTAALGLAHHRIPFVVLEEDDGLSSDIKAGTVLTRTLEIWNRYGVIEEILSAAIRIDEIGDYVRAEDRERFPVHLDTLVDETRFPFVANIPQSSVERILREAVVKSGYGEVLHRHRVTSFTQRDNNISVEVNTPNGTRRVTGSYLLGCDGGRSTIRHQLGYALNGHTLPERSILVDFDADIETENPRGYPYLSYFSDPEEWMILVRQPECWRLVFPLPAGTSKPSNQELLNRARRFIGDVPDNAIRNSLVYTVHQRIAENWVSNGRVFLLGDAAHLVTPVWALGMNTGILDASNVPWRLAWVLRHWATPSLLDGYETEQHVLAQHGSGEMAAAARRMMMHQARGDGSSPVTDWALAYTRSLLGVRLDVEGAGEWSMVMSGPSPPPIRPGDRLPDMPLFNARGAISPHELTRDCFAALHFSDVRRCPFIPQNNGMGLEHYVISRWDAPANSGLRGRTLLDVGGRLAMRLGVSENTIVLVRPDQHVAVVDTVENRDVISAYRAITGQ